MMDASTAACQNQEENSIYMDLRENKPTAPLRGRLRAAANRPAVLLRAETYWYQEPNMPQLQKNTLPKLQNGEGRQVAKKSWRVAFHSLADSLDSHQSTLGTYHMALPASCLDRFAIGVRPAALFISLIPFSYI